MTKITILGDTDRYSLSLVIDYQIQQPPFFTDFYNYRSVCNETSI